MNKIKAKAIGIIILAVISVINFSVPVSTTKNLPETVYYSAEAEKINIRDRINRFPVSSVAEMPVGQVKDERYTSDISVSLFGIIPVKTVRFVKKESVTLVPSGHSVGITIQTKGLLVIDTSDVCIDSNGMTVKSPAYAAGIRSGDIITHTNGVEVHTTDQLTALCTDEVHLTVNRDGIEHKFTVVPVTDKRTNEKRLGIWVREDTSGIGTLSFYDPKSGCFAALGHAVTDIDTGTACEIYTGSVSSCEIVSIEKGRGGSPGELIGIFSSAKDKHGRLISNTQYGIFGREFDTDGMSFLYPQGLPLAYPDEVHTGDAKIICTTDSGRPQEYQCMIVRCTKQDEKSVKGLIVEVTDDSLLEKTGGIVQGMSGSPIIQDNKLVGVVTHVMINNPHRGYGLYACWMWEECSTLAG